MKRVVGIIEFLLFSTMAFAAPQTTLVRVTTYWRAEGQLRAASNGGRLHEGHCAVDPKKIPYGSKIVLAGEELIAVDTGPAVVSRKAARLSGRTAAERNAIVVDRYFETKAQALAWEKSHSHFMTARIISPDRASRVVEKSVAGRKDSLPQTTIAARHVNETPALSLIAASVDDFYFRVALESDSNIVRTARRRTGGELLTRTNIIRTNRGWPRNNFRRSWS